MNLADDQQRYKVFLEASYAAESEDGKTYEKWRYYELRGPYGTLYPYSANQVALLVTSAIIAGRLRRTKRWRVLQAGDFETVFLMNDSDWQEAAQIIEARKQRSMSPELRQRAAERLAKWRYKSKQTASNGTGTPSDASNGQNGGTVR